MKKYLYSTLALIFSLFIFTSNVSATQVDPPTLERPEVTVSDITHNSLRLNWGAISAANGYQIEKSTNGTTWIIIDNTSDLFVDVTDLFTNTNYHFRVRAFLYDSEFTTYSDWSNILRATPVLRAPTFTTTFTHDTVRINITRVTGATGYEIWRSTSASGTFTRVGTTNTLTFTDTKLKFNTRYFYRVRAITIANGRNVFGPNSVVRNETPRMTVPTFTVTNIYNTNRIVINKTTSAAGYEIQRATGSGSFRTIRTGTALTINDLRLNAGTNYRYRIRAYRTINGKRVNSAWTPIQQRKVTLPQARFTATLSAHNAITINITRVPESSGYEIERSTNGRTWKMIRRQTGLAFNDTGLAANTTYHYRVRSFRTIDGRRVYGRYSTVINRKTAANRSVFARNTLTSYLRTQGFTCSGDVCERPIINGTSHKFDFKERTFILARGSGNFVAAASYDWKDKDVLVGGWYSHWLHSNGIWITYIPATDIIRYSTWDLNNYPTEFWFTVNVAQETFAVFRSYLRAAGVTESHLP